MKKHVEYISESITHVIYSPEENKPLKDCEAQAFDFAGRRVLTQILVEMTPKDVFRYEIDGEPVLEKKLTANGEVSYIANARTVPYRKSYSACLQFQIGADEMLLGLGQYEDGIMNYRNHTEYLYESNMRIAIPFLLTTGNYGILIDSESNMIFESRDQTVTFHIDTTKEISYYVFLGESIQQLICAYRKVTGKASMMPKWLFGYMQSKERYQTGEELLVVTEEFRKRQIPIDCLVQDWYSWEDGLWGEKIFDKKRYPNLKETVDSLHEKNVHFMVSIWPNMSPESANYAEFKEQNRLLPNSNLYNAFDEKARDLYWDQCRREIMASGTDALWCDNAEPFSDADWSGELKKTEEDRYLVVTNASKESMEWENLNSYGLYHAKGIYENWRKSYPNKRVVNLTRSGYTGCQKYGTILWSGDITAKWDTLRKQIVEGMKMSLCVPYWTLDIGGFFVVKDKYENRGCNDRDHLPLWFWDGDYNDGVLDLGYRELYTRWLQFGAFLPVFRSHGTDTPREPWNFGDLGDPFYDTIMKYIRLRYRLLPYIYSLAAACHLEDTTMMRPLLMEYPNDSEACKITDSYLFGPSLLVAPVYEPMYYGPGSEMIENEEKCRKVYLPKGGLWYDFDNYLAYEGGQTYLVAAPLEKMPVFVPAGAIIPMSTDMEYVNQNNQVDIIRVYEGKDGEFDLFVDAGEGYSYEQGEYAKVHFCYSEEEHRLSITNVYGKYPAQRVYEVEYISRSGVRREKTII